MPDIATRLELPDSCVRCALGETHPLTRAPTSSRFSQRGAVEVALAVVINPVERTSCVVWARRRTHGESTVRGEPLLQHHGRVSDGGLPGCLLYTSPSP